MLSGTSWSALGPPCKFKMQLYQVEGLLLAVNFVKLQIYLGKEVSNKGVDIALWLHMPILITAANIRHDSSI